MYINPKNKQDSYEYYTLTWGNIPAIAFSKLVLPDKGGPKTRY